VYSFHFTDDIQEMQERLSPKPWHPNISAAFYDEQQGVLSCRRSLKLTDDWGRGQEITEADLAAIHPDFGPRQLELAFTTETDCSETSLPILASTLLHPDTLLPLPFPVFFGTQDQDTRSSPDYVNHVGENYSTAPCVSSSHFIYLLNCAYHDPDFNLAWDEEDRTAAEKP